MRRALAALALGVAAAAGAAEPASHAAPAGHPARVEAWFTPGDDVARVISQRIAAARESVQVQAYLFTHRGIAAALARAARRGVAVEVIGDARQHESGGLPVLKGLDRAGARIWLSADHAAFHNKVVLVDAGTAGAVVVTGSFNFTQAAQEKNAENVVVISGSPEVAARFAREFERHRARASRLQ
ncbi:MAG TPA: phospholipase D-like domain-containing protein [Usitatibacteraceae bacterium]|nr:phospholipase D-like domain-containing protein [Usitatibacteraceae bacterium]HQY47762.1 phospholipase D-like domain-containing protein [Usitatibacteraceae bacterium]HRA22923.1 phospholipase D-like domain-containing protein [Usitatibacteraceae bacterium]